MGGNVVDFGNECFCFRTRDELAVLVGVQQLAVDFAGGHRDRAADLALDPLDILGEIIGAHVATEQSSLPTMMPLTLRFL